MQKLRHKAEVFLFCRGGKITCGDLVGGGLKRKVLTRFARQFLFASSLLQASLHRLNAKSPTLSCRTFIFVGAARFELATSWSQTRRDNRATLRPEQFFH
jgi:hypothetical protein